MAQMVISKGHLENGHFGGSLPHLPGTQEEEFRQYCFIYSCHLGTAEPYGRDGTGITGTGQTASVLSGAEPEFADLKQRVIRASESFARYRRTALPDRTAKSQNRTVGKRESAMAGINAEAEQREQLITDIKQQIEKARDIDERMRKLRERRAGGRTPGNDGTDAGRTGSERPDNSGTEQAAKQIADLEHGEQYWVIGRISYRVIEGYA